MTMVIQEIGMRISELCCLEIDNMILHNGFYYLNYFQYKTSIRNVVPLSQEIAELLLDAISETKFRFGDNSKYIFSKKVNIPISVDQFTNALNRLSFDAGIVGESGKLFRINSHDFRCTVSSRYANDGMSLVDIQHLLGQKTLASLFHYVEIYELTLMSNIKPLLDYQDSMIRNIGKEIKKEMPIFKEESIPLPNGCCVKPLAEGKCVHGYGLNCYMCAAFRPILADLPIYERQYEEARINVEEAKSNGSERWLQIHQDIMNNLMGIIDFVKEEIQKNASHA